MWTFRPTSAIFLMICLGLAQLFGGDGVQIIGMGITRVVGTGDLEGVLAAQGYFILGIPPEGDARPSCRENGPGAP